MVFQIEIYISGFKKNHRDIIGVYIDFFYQIIFFIKIFGLLLIEFIQKSDIFRKSALLSVDIVDFDFHFFIQNHQMISVTQIAENELIDDKWLLISSKFKKIPSIHVRNV